MTLLVGWTPAKNDRTAVQLGATLARSSGRRMVLVTTVPAPWPTPVAGDTDREFARWSREQAAQAESEGSRLVAELCPDVDAEVRAVRGRSVAATLVEQAAEVGAEMVVVGSGSDGSMGTVVVGSVADRLLHSSPVPVAVATRGYRPTAGGRVTRVTCAFRGDDASGPVLQRTATIAHEIGAALRVVTLGVRGRTMYPPEVRGEEQVLEAYVEQTSAAQAAAVARLDPAPADLETTVAVGRTWVEALDSLTWHHDEVLVVGSSPAGLVSRLFLGSTATKIVRHSPVPVVVVP